MILVYFVYRIDEENIFRGQVALSCHKEELEFKLSIKAEALPSNSLLSISCSHGPFLSSKKPLRYTRTQPSVSCTLPLLLALHLSLSIAMIYEDAVSPSRLNRDWVDAVPPAPSATLNMWHVGSQMSVPMDNRTDSGRERDHHPAAPEGQKFPLRPLGIHGHQ